MVALLTIVFAIGFNFYRVFLHSTQGIFHIESNNYVLDVSGVIASHNYRVFPSRKQLIADPKDDLLSRLSFTPPIAQDLVYSGTGSGISSDICLLKGKNRYMMDSLNIPNGHDDSFLAKICTFNI